MTSTLLQHPDGALRVEELPSGRRRVVVERAEGFVPVDACETAYPTSLIAAVLAVRGPAWTPQELQRDESPIPVELPLRIEMLGFVPLDAFAGGRVLDFGSGSGASSLVLARLLPRDVTIVGVELDAAKVEFARARAAFHGVDDRLSFHVSPDPSRLPDRLGTFDAILFSAVWEHLLPAERPPLLAMLWDHLAPGGVLFLNQTPHRWFPYESHTTGLPLIPFLPDALAATAARRLSRRIRPDTSWPQLLRMGIRGGTVGEILGLLRRAGHDADVLRPRAADMKDAIDVWYGLSIGTRAHPAKRVLRGALKGLRAVTGIELTPVISLALRKVG